MANVSLRKQAYDLIHAWIASGQLPKGSVTSEVELSRKLDMSRTPVRAALQQLELEGYVRIAPKHGVILLDSSSKRVGDLLETIVSMALFSVSVSWNDKADERIVCARLLSHQYCSIPQDDPERASALAAFDYELFRTLISLASNEEMDGTFRTAASRLFWNRNSERWKSLHARETSERLERLLATLEQSAEAFRDALFAYMNILKRSWL